MLNDNGIYMAMNRGLAKARGDYCIFLNCGDEILDGPTLKQLFDRTRLEGDNRHYGYAFMYRKEGLHYDICGYSDVIGAIKAGKLICQQSLMYNTRVLKLSGGFDESYKLAGDYEFMCRSIQLNQDWGFIPVVAVVYEDAGLSETRSVECLGEIYRIRTCYLGVGSRSGISACTTSFGSHT